MTGPADYPQIAGVVGSTGMVARGGFATVPADALQMPDGRPVRTVVMIGNVSGAMWARFRSEESSVPHPLDTWTRATLSPIATSFGASFVHPSDEPFQPFQRWAQRADHVWRSPIGLLIHGEFGLWHAYRGAFLFPRVVDGLPAIGQDASPCLSCAERPCLSACPVEAFTEAGYDAARCASHVRAGVDPDCLHEGCAARLACPVGADLRYGADQMGFHMRAFIGD